MVVVNVHVKDLLTLSAFVSRYHQTNVANNSHYWSDQLYDQCGIASKQSGMGWYL